jgi:hypothetical protein
MITIQDLKDAEERLERELKAVKSHILALVGKPSRKAGRARKKSVVVAKRRRMSAKGRAAIAAAQKKRWAKVKATKKSA